MPKRYIFLLLLLPLSSVLFADDAPLPVTEKYAADDASLVGPILPSTRGTISTGEPSVNWSGLMRQSMWFLSVEHTFRYATEFGTRNPGAPLLPGYFDSVRNLHGWSDGDPAYVNYLGHPMQGAVAGFIWNDNDLRYRNLEFGNYPRYWKSRLRAAGYSWAYSTQFEIGPVSEASIGAIQRKYPQQGLVDHVVTPVLGLGWMVAEDAVDRFILIPLEKRIQNTAVRIVARGFLNPGRSMANMVAGRVPFFREGRSLFATPAEIASLRSAVEDDSPGREAIPDIGPAPFELTAFAKQRVFTGSSRTGTCDAGGGAEAAFRMARHWQLVAEVSGCNLSLSGPNISGDALTWLIGPRWTPSERRLRPYVQLLAGGLKLTTEEVSPELGSRLEAAAEQKGLPPPAREQYATTSSTHGFAMSAGTGVDLKLARAAALKLASLSWTRSWTGPSAGIEYNRGLELSLGVTLRMGTW